MRTSILSVAFGLAALLALAGSGDVALGKTSRSGSASHEHKSGHMRDFNHKGRHYRFHTYGRDYRGWERRCWFPRYRCYGYYCPTRSCWYYWCASYTCYMPCSYITTFAPTPVNQNTNTNTNVNVNLNNSNSIGGGSVPVSAPGPVAVPTGAVPVMPGAAQ